MISASASRCISISIEDPMSPSNPKGLANHFSRCGLDKTTKPAAGSTCDRGTVDSSSSCEDSDNDNVITFASGVGTTTTTCTATSVSSTTTTTVPLHPTPSGDTMSEETGSDHQQSTMWLGTEDGCVHVYNCTDNIRIKKNKIKIQHVSAVYSIM